MGGKREDWFWGDGTLPAPPQAKEANLGAGGGIWWAGLNRCWEQALEFFKPVEEDVDLALHPSFPDHQELLAVWGDGIIDL